MELKISIVAVLQVELFYHCWCIQDLSCTTVSIHRCRLHDAAYIFNRRQIWTAGQSSTRTICVRSHAVVTYRMRSCPVEIDMEFQGKVVLLTAAYDGNIRFCINGTFTYVTSSYIAVCSCHVHFLSTRHLLCRPPCRPTSGFPLSLLPLVPWVFHLHSTTISCPFLTNQRPWSHSIIPQLCHPTASHFQMCLLSVCFVSCYPFRCRCVGLCIFVSYQCSFLFVPRWGIGTSKMGLYTLHVGWVPCIDTLVKVVVAFRW